MDEGKILYRIKMAKMCKLFRLHKCKSYNFCFDRARDLISFPVDQNWLSTINENRSRITAVDCGCLKLYNKNYTYMQENPNL